VIGSNEPPTVVTFELSAPVSPIAQDARVVQLRLTQAGFEENSKVMTGCARAWPEILSSVKTYVETDSALPGSTRHRHKPCPLIAALGAVDSVLRPTRT
jgi:hypothetical protein